MKINILKMQGGGDSSQAYGLATYVPLVFNDSSGKDTSKTESTTSTNDEDPLKGVFGVNKDGLFTDSTAKELLGKGLTSDVNEFMNEVYSMYNTDNPFDSESTLNSATLARRQTVLISRMNQILNSKAQFDDSVKGAVQRESLDSVAVNKFGKVIARDTDGNLKYVSPDMLYNNIDKYIPLTNSDIATLRMNNTNFAYDTELIDIVQNSVGIKQVGDYISGILNSANGKTSSSVRGQYPVDSGLPDDVANGLIMLRDHTETVSSNDTQIKAAVKYIYATMPTDYQKFLKADAAAKGIDPKNISEMIINLYAASKLDNSSSVSDSYAKFNTSAGAKAGTKGKGDGSLTNQSQIEQVAQGEAASLREYRLRVGDSAHQLEYNAGKSPYWNTPTDSKGNPLPSYMSLEGFLKTKFGVISDRSAIMLGNQELTPDQFGKVGIDTTQGLTMAILPTSVDPNGKIVADMDAIKGIAEAEQAEHLNESSTMQQRVAAYKKHGVPQAFWYMRDVSKIENNMAPNATQQDVDIALQKAGIPSAFATAHLLESGALHRFLVGSAFASDNNVIDTKSNTVAERVDPGEGDSLETELNKYLVSNKQVPIDFTKGFPFRALGMRVGSQNMYRVNVLIPYTDSAAVDAVTASDHAYQNKRSEGKLFGYPESTPTNITTQFKSQQ